jgi:endonuclease/exonuclease/phosphatase family metal-dependent hydrolase
MNAKRRKQIAEIIAKLEDIQADVLMLQEAEVEALENLPEGLQAAERGQAMQEAAEQLESASQGLEESINNLQEAQA